MRHQKRATQRGHNEARNSALALLLIASSLVVIGSRALAATRMSGINSSSKYLQYYGSDFSTSNLQLISTFDVVVLDANAAQVTPATVAYLQSNGVKYVLAYISIGEQTPGTPVITGNGNGPVYCTTNGTATVMYESNNVASFYMDEAWSNSISAYVIKNNGTVNRNSTFGGPYVWPNSDWRWVLNTQRTGGVPGTSLSNMFVAGLAQIAGNRVSNTDTTRTNNFGFDGFFLDTLDTAGPYAGPGYYPWAAPEMQNTVAFIYNSYTNKIVFANRGLFFYDPLLVNTMFGVQPYAYTIRPYIHAALFESYMLGSSTCDTALTPYANDNKYDYARKIVAEAGRPDGFTVFCLDYQISRPTKLYELAMNEAVVSNGWVEYLCPDAGLDTVGTYALNHPRPADSAPPVWDSTATPGLNGESTSCPNSDTLSSDPTPARAGIQAITTGSTAGTVLIHWDVALDQTPPVKYNIYRSSSPQFSSYVAYSNVAFQVGDGWSTDPTTYFANQYTIQGLSPGTYYFRVRAQDSSAGAYEETNTVTQSITLANTRYNAVAPGGIVINGDLSDWTALFSFGVVPEAFTPTSTNPVDLAQLWMAHDATNFYVAYQNYGPTTGGLNAAYNLYLDTDTNRTTGYRGGANNFPIGADYLLQGGTLYRYTGSTGTDWSWSEVGIATSAVATSNVEFSVPRMWMGNPTQMNLFFYGDNTALPGGTLQDQYPTNALQSGGGGGYVSYEVTDVANPVPDGSIAVDGNLTDWAALPSFGTNQLNIVISSSNKVDLAQVWMAHDETNFYVAYQNYGPIGSNDLGWGYTLYLDTDGNLGTGYRGSATNFPIGADYMLQGTTVYQYAGTNGTDWNWNWVGSATSAANGNDAEFSFPRGWIGNPSLLRLFFWGDNTAYGGTAEELYPNNALNAGGGDTYLAYRITDVSNPIPLKAIVVDGNLSDWVSLTSFGMESPGFSISTSNTVDLAQLWMAHDATNLYIACQNYGPTTNGLNAAYNLYLDTDGNRSTGYRGGANNFPIGADYLLQGSSLYQYTGSTGTDWNWTFVGTATAAVATSNAEFSLPRAWLGNPDLIKLFFLDDNPSIGGTLQDAYPRNALQSGGGGGWFAYRILAVAQNGDSVGDGIPDWWRKMFFGGDGTTTNAPGSCASCDADGDGFNNLQEYLAGTDPTNSASAFRITSVTRTGANLLVTWTMGSGKTNALQAAPGDGMGNFSTNSFTDRFIVTNTVGTITNYLDIGAATNMPAGYYRVRLVP